MRLLCFFPRAACASGNRCAPSGSIRNGRQLTQCRRSAHRARVAAEAAWASNAGPVAVHLVHELFVRRGRTQANNPGPMGSTLVLVLARKAGKEMQHQLQDQPGKPLVTHPRHTDIACGCTVKNAAEAASSLSAPPLVTTRCTLCGAKEGGCWLLAHPRERPWAQQR